MKEHEYILNTNIDTKIDDLKGEASSSINKKLSPLNLNNPPSSYNQPSANTNKWPLIKSQNFHSHASQLTKHISHMTLEGDTLLQLQKWWDTICSTFCQSLSTNKSLPPYKKIKAENYDITKFILLPDTHSKYVTAKENFEALSRALRFQIVKYNTI